MNQLDFEQMEKDFLKTVDLLRLKAYAATGYEWVVVPRTGGYRSIKEQHGLYVQAHDGLDNDKDGKIDEPDECVTKADGGQSPHNFDLARDLVPSRKKGDLWWEAPKGLFKEMGAIAESLGLVWGGNFKSIYDPPHVECKRWREAKLAWQKGEIKVA